MSIEFRKIVDISLELDPKNFAMRTPAGFKKDMQFEMEVIKEHDAPGGAGQIVRGVHMRLHAGSHVDAPEHNVRGGTQIHQLPLQLFIGDAIATYAVTNGSTGPMIAPFTADPAQAVASLDRLDGLEARWVLPGHGQPWTGGVGEAVRRLRAAGSDGMGRPAS